VAAIWLNNFFPDFPDPSDADADGLLAVGGDLTPSRLLAAYKKGIFPWQTQPIAWFSPDPRMVLFPEELKISHSMRALLKQNKFKVTCNQAFETVMHACGKTARSGQDSTWIDAEIIAAYSRMNQLGFAHSIEVWADENLVGGLYGIALGRVFYGESMFATTSNASKYGFISLVKRLQELGFWLIDCQQETKHLGSLGARPITRTAFLEILARNEKEETFLFQF
jgi:leucyl/phenylalanyl-tRNA---protein transferase